jgi:hypothetical protein
MFEDADIPGLSTQYHRSRMFLVLFSALLGAWELLGCKVDGKLAGVLAIEHQYLVPWVLLLCTLYYAFRVGVEWFQSDNRRRSAAASMLDLTVAYAIAVAAALVFGLQQAGVNIGDELKGVPTMVALAAFISGIMLWGCLSWTTLMLAKKVRYLQFGQVAVLLIILAFLPLVDRDIDWWFAFPFAGAGLAVTGAVQFWMRWFFRRWRRKPYRKAE